MNPSLSREQNSPSFSSSFSMTARIEELKNRIEKLSSICQNLNPYDDIPENLKKDLATFQILELHDPFKVTNSLLLLLEDSIDELHMLSPLSEIEKSHETF